MDRNRKDISSEGDSPWRSASLGLAIPGVMVAGPLVGILLGRWLGGMIGHSRAGLVAGLALGLAAGVRETIRLIRRLDE